MRRPALLLAASAALLLAAPANADATHVVQPGETLWQIAAALSGNPHRWPEIYRANRDQIKDPSTLYPGQELAIPDFGGARPTSQEAAPAEDPPEDG
ncbi:MAG: LysM peptidoglycan-binding domain-containing protein [Myxococcota bacterium]